ncbi:MAG: cation transporter [Ktedonobacterales bacterium]|nr:cation transporter [Ktedonobacterales bacterium]
MIDPERERGPAPEAPTARDAHQSRPAEPARRPLPGPGYAPRPAAARFAAAVRGPLLGLCVNLVLVVVKAFGGVLSGSAALLADAGHSGADVANNVLVLASLLYSRRPADETHPYGHDRAEVLAAIGSAYLLGGAGIFFGWDSIHKLIVGTPTPKPLALWIALGTLAVKLVIVRVEMAIARDVASQAVLADARDNLADVLSSVAVIIGVLGARLGVIWLDGAAGLAIALLILVTAARIAVTAGNELLEPNLSEALLGRVRQAAGQVPGVRSVTAVTGRAHGSDMLVELSVEVDPRLEVAHGAAIADHVREAIYDAVPEVGDAMVELNTDHVTRLRGRLC